MFIIKFFFWLFVLSFIILPLLGSMGLRLLKFKFRKEAKKQKEKFSQFQQQQQTQEQQYQKNEKLFSPDEGEYVDYEEIE